MPIFLLLEFLHLISMQLKCFQWEKETERKSDSDSDIEFLRKNAKTRPFFSWYLSCLFRIFRKNKYSSSRLIRSEHFLGLTANVGNNILTFKFSDTIHCFLPPRCQSFSYASIQFLNVKPLHRFIVPSALPSHTLSHSQRPARKHHSIQLS